MFRLALVIAIVFVLLLAVEYLWRVKHFYSEVTRKFIHITVGTFAAFWPFFLSWHQILILSILFFIGIVASSLLTIFGSIHIIGRKTFGEMLFAVSIGLVAIITHNRLIFMTALLHLSLADGFAAIFGTKYGKKFRYNVFDQPKTLVGTTVFFVTSFLLICIYFLAGHSSGAWPTILWLPVATTLFENIGFRGLDNVLVPALVALSLRFF